jgi:hypothetical protein
MATAVERVRAAWATGDPLSLHREFERMAAGGHSSPSYVRFFALHRGGLGAHRDGVLDHAGLALNASDDSTAENACSGDWFRCCRRAGAVSAPPPVRGHPSN